MRTWFGLIRVGGGEEPRKGKGGYIGRSIGEENLRGGVKKTTEVVLELGMSRMLGVLCL
jgi:hypothetical protein